jgi:hypothetical protein
MTNMAYIEKKENFDMSPLATSWVSGAAGRSARGVCRPACLDRSVVPSSPDGGHASCERSVVTAMGSSGPLGRDTYLVQR